MKSSLSTIEVARLLGVSRCSVNNWIRHNKMRAYTTPGGHYKVQREELIRFVSQYNLPPVSGLQKKPERILIIDDEPRVLQVLSMMLSMIYDDVTVKQVDNGFDAADMVHVFKPDLILLDIGMNQLDGFNVCEKLKNRSATASIKIIMITGMTGEDLRDRAFLNGADGFLTKPVHREKLENEIAFVFQMI